MVVVTTEELERLERFERVAKLLGAEPAPRSNKLQEEIDYYQGRLNARLYLDADDWMLPSWAILTLKDTPRNERNLKVLKNSSYRSWSLLGGPGASHYAIADSRGLITACPICGSIDIWVSGPRGIMFPALMDRDGPRFRMISPEDQLYEWKTDVGPVEFTRLGYHVEIGGSNYVYNEIVIRNLGLEDAQAGLHVAVRPMSQLGFEPIERIEYRQGRLLTNSVPAILFDSSPSSVIMGRADDDDLPRKVRIGDGRFDDHFEDAEGLATVVLTFNIHLKPAGCERLFFVSPLGRGESGQGGGGLEPSEKHRDAHVESWFSFSEEHTSASFPDEVLDSAFRQCIASLAMQASSVLFPRQVDDSSLPWSNRIRVILALIRSGCSSVVTKMLRNFVSLAAGRVSDMEPNTLTPITWLLLYVIANNFSEDETDSLQPLALAAVERILNEHETIHIDEADSTPEEDSDELLQHYLVIGEGVFSELEGRLWTLATLKLAQAVIAKWMSTEFLGHISDAVASLEAHIEEDIGRISEARWPRTQDSTMAAVDSEILGFLTAITLLRINIDEFPYIGELAQKLEKRRSVKGLWNLSHPKDLFSSHLLLRLAQFYCLTKQRNKVDRILRRSLEFLTEDFFLPEYVDIRTFGGSAGSGACVLAAADLVLLLRDMLLWEESGSIVLLPGVPDEWYTSKKSLHLEGLPTGFGNASIQIGISTNQHQIEISAPELPGEIELHVPPSVPMPMVKAYGASIVERNSKAHSPHLRLIPHSETVVVTFHK